jgi:hypothetical protein
MTNVLYCGLKYDYGIIDRGLSWEYQNIYESLKECPGINAYKLCHDLFKINFLKNKKNGNVLDEYNKEIINLVKNKNIKIVFIVIFQGNEIFLETINKLKQKGTYVVCQACDDTWRYESLSKKIAGNFSFWLTPNYESIDWFKKDGINNVIYSPFCVNPKYAKYRELKKKGDVCFIGQIYGKRVEYINYIQKMCNKDGIVFSQYGFGTQGGRISYEDYFRIIQENIIVLNFSSTYFNWKQKQFKARHVEVPFSGGIILSDGFPFMEKVFNGSPPFILSEMNSPNETYIKIKEIILDKSDEMLYNLNRIRKEGREKTKNLIWKNQLRKIINENILTSKQILS